MKTRNRSRNVDALDNTPGPISSDRTLPADSPHIVTFYSFKGGVGRTQALVNVGVELAQRGRRVLLVDFDLEAPGIDTYPLPKPQEPPAGLVEFVSDYVSTGESPDASKYIYECPNVGRKGGRLWVMPSGRQDETYARRLSEIDWHSLYADQNGYLLFEDLKEQWRQILAPEYILVDSRTGHSDVSGICTRQLPHTVVALFFPTDQNLRGLPKIVDDIRAEQNGAAPRTINLLFVMSNVPDLDDEDQILEHRITLFANTLHYEQLTAVIHRYDNLALLNQVVFTADRPRSRLAREYRALTDRVIEQNLRDREGALTFLRALGRRSARGASRMSRTDVEKRLSSIRQTHDTDGEILQRLADLRMNEGRYEDAGALWTRLVELKAATPYVLLRRAEARTRTAEPRGALDDVQAVLDSRDAADYEIVRALNLLSSLAPERLRSVASAPAIQNLEADRKFWVARQLAADEGLEAARDILRQLLTEPPADGKDAVRVELILTLMGLGEVEDAKKLLSESAEQDASVQGAFNYAMAVWASEGSIPERLFRRVIELDEDNGTANYSQCLAVAFGAVGNLDDAYQRLNQARQRLAAQPELTFSCWRYQTVSADDFLDDLEEVRQFIEHRSVRPMFFDKVPTQQ
jgi:MinD-like ATPase involved in chromosome partitioning or flagellar assembly/thioredoxin-like negative regulator of GroEL